MIRSGSVIRRLDILAIKFSSARRARIRVACQSNAGLRNGEYRLIIYRQVGQSDLHTPLRGLVSTQLVLYNLFATDRTRRATCKVPAQILCLVEDAGGSEGWTKLEVGHFPFCTTYVFFSLSPFSLKNGHLGNVHLPVDQRAQPSHAVVDRRLPLTFVQPSDERPDEQESLNGREVHDDRKKQHHFVQPNRDFCQAAQVLLEYSRQPEKSELAMRQRVNHACKISVYGLEKCFALSPSRIWCGSAGLGPTCKPVTRAKLSGCWYKRTVVPSGTTCRRGCFVT